MYQGNRIIGFGLKNICLFHICHDSNLKNELKKLYSLLHSKATCIYKEIIISIFGNYYITKLNPLYIVCMCHFFFFFTMIHQNHPFALSREASALKELCLHKISFGCDVLCMTQHSFQQADCF